MYLCAIGFRLCRPPLCHPKVLFRGHSIALELSVNEKLALLCILRECIYDAMNQVQAFIERQLDCLAYNPLYQAVADCHFPALSFTHWCAKHSTA